MVVPKVTNVLGICHICIVQGMHSWCNESCEELLTLCHLAGPKSKSGVKAITIMLEEVLQGKIIFRVDVNRPILIYLVNAIITLFDRVISENRQSTSGKQSQQPSTVVLTLLLGELAEMCNFVEWQCCRNREPLLACTEHG